MSLSMVLRKRVSAVIAKTFARTRLPSSRLSWSTQQMSGPGWCRLFIRERTGWFVQQLIKVVGCCPGGQAINVSRCSAVTPADILAVVVASRQAGVWKRRDGSKCKSRAWRTLVILYPATSTHNQSISV